jgi:hypothetical protein
MDAETVFHVVGGGMPAMRSNASIEPRERCDVIHTIGRAYAMCIISAAQRQNSPFRCGYVIVVEGWRGVRIFVYYYTDCVALHIEILWPGKHVNCEM